jgi:hypothetical protein
MGRRPPLWRKSERTRCGNPGQVGSRRLALETFDVADFDPGKARFDKPLPININVFWTEPARG